jgi:hypothetical protein
MLPMIALQTEIKFGLPGGKSLASFSREELAAGMDTELGNFERFFVSQGNGKLIGPERAILKTYLAWKALYEETDVDSQTGERDHG